MENIEINERLGFVEIKYFPHEMGKITVIVPLLNVKSAIILKKKF